MLLSDGAEFLPKRLGNSLKDLSFIDGFAIVLFA